MPTRYFFNNREILLPGVYGTIKSGITNPSLSLAFGNTLLIDTNSGAQYGGGSGISGTLQSGKDAIYTFNNIRDFRDFVGGGFPWLIAAPLFQPTPGNAGISSLTYIRAAATVPSQLTYSFTGGGANGGTFTLQNKTEGIAGNGYEADSTRATVSINITNAGNANDTISIITGGIAIGTYTVNNGNAAADVASGLASDINSKNRITGFSALHNSGSSNFTLTSPIWDATTTVAVTTSVTGAVTANAGNFSGGSTGTIHVGGFAARMVAGIDPAKFAIEFYRGNYKGNDALVSTGTLANEPYDDISLAESGATLITKSTDFTNINELLSWMRNSSSFNERFVLLTSNVNGDGSVDATDLSNNVGNKLFSGGTESYNMAHLNNVLDNITDLNFDFILADKWGAEARSVSNLSILSFITSEAQIKPDLIIGGGLNSGQFTQTNGSVPTAVSYNSEFVTIVHGGVGISVSRGDGFKEYQSVFHAAAVLGREAGLPPQVPLLFKNLGVSKLLDGLNDNRARQGLEFGVLMTRRGDTSFEVVKGVNSLQRNDFLINQDGTTSSKQLRRIVRQLNKEIIFNLKNTFLKQKQGPNRNTAAPEDIEQYVKAFLQAREASDTADNLIIAYQNVNVRVVQDAYFVEYQFVPNFELSFIFTTGFIIDPSINN